MKWLGVSVFILFVVPAWAEIQVKVTLDPKALYQKEDKKLLEQLTNNSELTIKNDFPEDLKDKSLIKLWAKQKKQLIKKSFSSEGFYLASIELLWPDDDSVTYLVTPNKPFKFGQIHLNVVSHPSTNPSSSQSITEDLLSSALTLQTGQYAKAKQVIENESVIRNAIDPLGCFFYVNVSHKAHQIPDASVIDITYDIEIGPEAYIHSYQFQGLTSVKESYLRKIMTLKPNTCYRASVIQQSIIELQETNLFNSIDIQLPETPNADGQLDIILEVEERPHRTLSTGLSFSSEEKAGVGIELGWQHRNFWGQAEHFTSKILSNGLGWEWNNSLKKPHFLHPRQSLSLGQALGQEDTFAYDSDFFSVSAALNRAFFKNWLGTIGIEYKFTAIEEEDSEFNIIKLPMSISHDTRKDLLNPKQGHHIGLQWTPYWAEEETFESLIATAQFYFPFPLWKSSTIATRLSAGTITGSTKENVPVTDRFYTGGGGSVRGYPYQSLGPQSEDNTPEGALNYIESAIEWRFPLYQNIGAVLFADGGYSYDSKNNNIDNNNNEPNEMYWGGGVGLRYYTDFGPIRFDIASPISDTEELDIEDKVQLYFSIGQSF